MRDKSNTRLLIICAVAGGLLALCPGTSAGGDLSAKQVRKLITRFAGFDLPTDKVRVKGVSPVDATTIEAKAEIETAFRLQRNENSKWRVAEIRTGRQQWEGVESIARALKAGATVSPCDEPDLTAKPAASEPTVRHARCLLAELLGVQLPSDAVRVREVLPLSIPMSSQPSALVVAKIDIDFRLSRTGNSAWRVAGVRTGNREWADPDVVLAAVNLEKGAQARAELASIAKALEAFRHDRGFYVESNSEAVLIDHLSPQYLSSVIRVDPWQRPYRYEATRDHFTLRSTGPDGKENTDDDVVVNNSTRP